MITIEINKDEKNKIVSFSLNGHAGYKKRGSDIVCSAISAVTNMVIVGLAEKLNIRVECEKTENGFLSCKLPKSLHPEEESKTQFLLECMVEEFKDIESNYEENVKVIMNHAL